MKKFYSIWLFVVVLLLVGCGRDSAEKSLTKGIDAAVHGKWNEAAKYAETARKLAPDNVDVLIFQAVAAENVGNMDLAFDAASGAVRRSPGCFEAQYLYGRLCSIKGRDADAVLALNNALELKRGDQASMILLVNSAVRINHRNALLWLNQLRAQNGAKMAQSAKERQSAIENQQGVIAFMSNKKANALRHFGTALKLTPNDPIAHLNMAVCYDAMGGNNSVARAYYAKFVKLATKPELNAYRLAAVRRMQSLTVR